jgi:hypothetical protein
VHERSAHEIIAKGHRPTDCAFRPRALGHACDFVGHGREVYQLLGPDPLKRLLADEAADASGGRGAHFRGLADACCVVANRRRIVGVGLEEVGRCHDRVEHVVDVVQNTGGKLSHRGEPRFARVVGLGDVGASKQDTGARTGAERCECHVDDALPGATPERNPRRRRS